jgi:pimeloyl-ACP methyl ester carboxylesterase
MASRTRPDPAQLEAQAHRSTVRAGSGEVTWRSWGDGRPVLLLHGDAGSWTHWVRTIPVLAQRVRVIAPDLPGYGDSAPPPSEWAPATLAAILAGGFPPTLGAGPCAIVGFSFGGIVAAHLAAEVACADRLVLLGPGGVGLPSQHRSRPLRRMAQGMSEAERREVHRHNLGALMFHDPRNVDDGAVRLHEANIARSRLRIGGWPDSDALLRGLARSRVPVHAFWGEFDAFAYPHVRERGDAVRDLRPDADVRVVRGAGHWVQYEAADAVNAMLLEILG